MNRLGLICMVVLEAPARLDQAAVLEALKRAAPRSDINVETRTKGGDTGLTVRIDRREFAAVSLPVSMPEPEFGEIMRHGMFWPGRHAALKDHRGFVAVSAVEEAKGHGLLRAQAVALTRLAVAVAETVPSLGLCWPSALSVCAADRLARAPEDIIKGRWPVDIWIGYGVFGSERRGEQLVGARTLGAQGFFGAEIEVMPFPTADKMEPLRILLNTTGFLMANGPHITSGQPVQVRGERKMQFDIRPGPDGQPAAIRLVASPGKANGGGKPAGRRAG